MASCVWKMRHGPKCRRRRLLAVSSSVVLADWLLVHQFRLEQLWLEQSWLGVFCVADDDDDDDDDDNCKHSHKTCLLFATQVQ
jgi:hypothetical protein